MISQADPNTYRSDIGPSPQTEYRPDHLGCIWAFTKALFLLATWSIVVAAAIKYLWRG